MIEIHYDFVDGTEVSYEEGLILKDNFSTNCLDFFNNDIKIDDVIVIDKYGNKLSRKELMANTDSRITAKYMRKSHNIQKMLKANVFNWRRN